MTDQPAGPPPFIKTSPRPTPITTAPSADQPTGPNESLAPYAAGYNAGYAKARDELSGIQPIDASISLLDDRVGLLAAEVAKSNRLMLFSTGLGLVSALLLVTAVRSLPDLLAGGEVI